MKNLKEQFDLHPESSERSHLNSTVADNLAFLKSFESKLNSRDSMDLRNNQDNKKKSSENDKRKQPVVFEEENMLLRTINSETDLIIDSSASNSKFKQKYDKQGVSLQQPKPTLAHLNSLPVETFSALENPLKKKKHSIILRETVMKKAENLGTKKKQPSKPEIEIKEPNILGEKDAQPLENKESIFQKKAKNQRKQLKEFIKSDVVDMKQSFHEENEKKAEKPTDIISLKSDSEGLITNENVTNKPLVDSIKLNPLKSQNVIEIPMESQPIKDPESSNSIPRSILKLKKIDTQNPQKKTTSTLFKENSTETSSPTLKKANTDSKSPVLKRSSIANLWKNITVKRINQIQPEEKRTSVDKDSKQKHEHASKFGVFKVLGAVSKFKSLIKYKRYQNLNLNQLNIIDDRCYIAEKRNIEDDSTIKESNWFSNFINNMMTKLNKTLLQAGRTIYESSSSKMRECTDFVGRKIKPFNPRARWKMTWDLINMILIFWNFMIISIAISFGQPVEDVFLFSELPNRREWYLLFLIMSFLNMMVDIIFTLNTRYYEMGVFVSDRKKIFKNYLKRNLIIDIVAEVPFFCQIMSYETVIDADVVKYLNCLFFLKYYNLKGVFKVLEEFLSLDDKYEAFFSLMKLFVKIFFVAHLMACLWHSAAYFGRTENDKTWLLKKNLCVDDFWTERYIYSVYFALTTMTTVGYGDITPENQREVLVAMLTMLVGSAMFGYSINSIGDLLKKMNQKEDQLKKDVTLLDRYMKSKKIENELQARARKYLEFVWNEEKVVNQENADEILEKLSSNIKEEVLLQSNGKFLLNYPMLCKNFCEKTMRKLINHIKPVRYSPEEIIFEEGETSLNPALYLIAQGEIELCLPIQKGESDICRLKNLKEGTAFGEISFFTDLPQAFTARSLNYSTVYLLNKIDFINIIAQNSDDWEKFCMIRDKIHIYEDYEELYLKCYSCNDKHFVRKCPAIQYVPNKMKIIYIHQYRIKKRKTQRRKLFKPRSKRRFNALFNNNEIESKTQPIQSNHDTSNLNLDSGRELIFDDLPQREKSPLHMQKLEADLGAIKIRPLDYRPREETSLSHISLASPLMISPSLQPHRSVVGKRKSMAPIPMKMEEVRKQKNFKELHLIPLDHNENSLAIANELQNEQDLNELNKNLSSHATPNKEELFMMNFDYYKNYNNYFIRNNPNAVLIRIAFKAKFGAKKKPLSQLFLGTKMFSMPSIKNILSVDSPLLEMSSPKKSNTEISGQRKVLGSISNSSKKSTESDMMLFKNEARTRMDFLQQQNKPDDKVLHLQKPSEPENNSETFRIETLKKALKEAMEENDILRDRVTSLEALLAAAEDEIEKKDKALLELYHAYQTLQGSDNVRRKSSASKRSSMNNSF